MNIIFYCLTVFFYTHNTELASAIELQQIYDTNKVDTALIEIINNLSKQDLLESNSLYSQYSIFKSIKEKNGAIGSRSLSILPISGQLQNHFKKIIGRIFIINKEGDLISGSGILVYQEGQYKILTVKHNFKKPQGYFYYFVPAVALNLKTGFFDGLRDEVFLQDLLAVLSRHSYTRVQRIDITRIQKINHQFVTAAELDLDDDHFTDEAVLCPYEKDLPDGIDEVRIDIDDCDPISTNEIERGYYAMGFPSLPYLFDETISIWADGGFDCLAPITVTSSKVMITSKIHHAPTAKGMSGGPVLIFRNGKPKIVGLIKGGKFKSGRPGVPLVFENHYLTFFNLLITMCVD
jgi:hypothetical protein